MDENILSKLYQRITKNTKNIIAIYATDADYKFADTDLEEKAEELLVLKDVNSDMQIATR